MSELFPQITAELLNRAFLGTDVSRSGARGKIFMLLDGDFAKADALAKEYGLQNFSDMIHKGKPLSGTPKALTTATQVQELRDDAPKGSNPWVADTVDENGKPAWSLAARQKQIEVCRTAGAELGARLAAAANSFLGAPRPGAVDRTPRNGNKDMRVKPNMMDA